MIRLLLLFTMAGVIVCQPAAADDAKSRTRDAEVRKVIERSLPFVKREGVRWIEKRKCVTCHQVPFMIWSLNAAAHRGFKVEPDQLKKWNDWATDWRNFAAAKNKKSLNEQKTVAANIDTIYQLLMATRPYLPEDSGEEKISVWTNHLLTTQSDDGSWKPCGQLPSQRRPARETREVTTMWSLVALNDTGIDIPELQKRRATAMTWLGDAKEVQSTEWWVTKLLLESKPLVRSLGGATRKKLISAQHDDGGWGWLIADDSDAFGTGLAIYALLHTGTKRDDPMIGRACRFLLKSQQDNGSWKVQGTKKKAAGRVTATATYWGTCWAVIGLLETLAPPTDARK